LNSFATFLLDAPIFYAKLCCFAYGLYMRCKYTSVESEKTFDDDYYERGSV